jgi:allantoicase
MTNEKVEITRTPARKMTREDLANVTNGGLMLGCCTQGCCKSGNLLDLPGSNLHTN